MDEEAKTAEEIAAEEATAAEEAKKVEEAAAAEVAGKVDYEEQYKRLQADHTLRSQQLAEAQARIEQLEQPPESPDEDLDLGEEGFIDKKTATQMINSAVSKAVSRVREESADNYFRKTYPELVEYENAIAGIMRSPKKPLKDGVTAEERIDAAVKEFKALTEEQVTKAKEQAEAEAKEKEEAKRKASGLGPSSPTTPKSDDEGKSEAEELADRKAQQAKKRSLA